MFEVPPSGPWCSRRSRTSSPGCLSGRHRTSQGCSLWFHIQSVDHTNSMLWAERRMQRFSIKNIIYIILGFLFLCWGFRRDERWTWLSSKFCIFFLSWFLTQTDLKNISLTSKVTSSEWMKKRKSRKNVTKKLKIPRLGLSPS